MRCVEEIRADGVAPVPVADACLHSQQTAAESCLPPTHNAVRCALGRVYSIAGGFMEPEYRQDAQWLPISLKTRRGVGAGPHHIARIARVLYLVHRTTRAIVTTEKGKSLNAA